MLEWYFEGLNSETAKGKLVDKATKLGGSLAAQAGNKIFCQDPPGDLTDVQLAALHLCKSEILAAIYRLYMVVPQEIADDIIGEYVTLPRDEGKQKVSRKGRKR